MNPKLLLRVTAPALVIGLLLLAACLASARSISRLQASLAAVLSQNVRNLRAALELEIRVRQLRFHTFLYLLDPAPDRLKPVGEDQAGFEEALRVVRQFARSPEETASVRAIEEGYVTYQAELAGLRAEVARHQPLTDTHKLAELAHPVKFIVDPCNDLLALNQNRMEQVAEESRRVSGQAQLAMLLLGLGGAVSGGVMGYGMARGLSQSIYRLSVRIQDMAHRLDDVAPVSVVADGDLTHLDRQMDHVVRRVEETAERLKEQQRQLIRTEQLSALGQLAAGVAHEVRNPLAAIKLLVEAAARPHNTKSLNAEDLRVIHREIARLENTVESFLRFARLPAPRRSPHDLREVLARAGDLVEARAAQQNVDLRFRTPAEPVLASVDQDQLVTVLVNLFLNALDAMPQGGSLDVGLEVPDNDGVRLTVTDTGTGIPPQMAGRLFTPFATTKPTGTGLGLSLSGRIVEEHGGHITGANRPEGGARFDVTLPLNRGQGSGVRGQGKGEPFAACGLAGPERSPSSSLTPDPCS